MATGIGVHPLEKDEGNRAESAEHTDGPRGRFHAGFDCRRSPRHCQPAGKNLDLQVIDPQLPHAFQRHAYPHVLASVNPSEQFEPPPTARPST
ncbi:MAG TPA: hypothetical protein DER64_08080, partial [Planctomycetaceae bacterium]|nr:hypothetical protein [Planctomycetaceae bacterium]